MKNHCALCTNGHLFIALHTFHLYGNETMSPPGLFACLSCPVSTMEGGEETRESQEVFTETNLRPLFQGQGKEEPCKRDVQCHSQSKFSSHGRIHICSEEHDCSVCTQIYEQLYA